MKILKLGVIGLGDICHAYLSNLQKYPDKIELYACACRTPSKAEEKKEKYGFKKAYADGDTLLKDPEIDVILNLTTPAAHYYYNLEAVKAGKHVYSEKPLAATFAEGKEIVDLARQKGLYVGCAPDTFLASGLQSMRYYLDAGLIGKPFAFTANMTNFGAETWHPNPAPFYRKGCGPLYDMAPYYLSALVALLGPVESIAAFSAKPHETRHVYTGPNAGAEIPAEIPTHYTAVLRFRCGAVGNLNVSFDICRSDLPMLEIYGDAGTLAYPDPNFGGGTPKVYRKEQLTDTVYQHTPEAEERRKTFRELPELFTRAKDYSRGIGVLDLAAAIERGTPNRASEEIVIHITEAIEGILLSAESGEVYRMRTTCGRPEPLKPGCALNEI